MSGVGGVSGAGQVSVSSEISGGGLTTDAVMLYCASQLNHLDEGIKQHMAQQQVARNQADKLGKLKGLLTGEIAAGDSSRKAEIVAAMKEAFDSLPPNDPRREKLNDTFHRFMNTVTFNNQSNRRVTEGGNYHLSTLTEEQIGNIASNGTQGNETDDNEMKRFAADIDPMLTEISKGAGARDDQSSVDDLAASDGGADDHADDLEDQRNPDGHHLEDRDVTPCKPPNSPLKRSTRQDTGYCPPSASPTLQSYFERWRSPPPPTSADGSHSARVTKPSGSTESRHRSTRSPAR